MFANKNYLGCQPTASTTNHTACNTYTWNNTVYTNSGTYIYTTTNAQGCDSVATLNLTIKPLKKWFKDEDHDGYYTGSPINSCEANVYVPECV